MKNFLKWGLIAISIPLILLITLATLLYLPPIQRWAVKEATQYASREMGMNITIGGVRLHFPLDLRLEDVAIVQPSQHQLQADTLARVRDVVVDIQLIPLFSKQVMIDELAFHQMKVNTMQLVKDAKIQGSIGTFTLQSHGIDLGKEQLKIDKALLADADIDVALNDSVPQDTTKTENFWKINVEKVQLLRSKATIHLSNDSTDIMATWDEAQIEGGRFDLYKGHYALNHFFWNGGNVHYDQRYAKQVKGLDPNHLALDKVHLLLRNLDYISPQLNVQVDKLAFQEKSGIAVSQLQTKVFLDSTHVALPYFRLNTPESSIEAKVKMDFNTFDKTNPGKMNVDLHAKVGKTDMRKLAANVPVGLWRKLPNYPVELDAVLRGNMKSIQILNAKIKMPTACKIIANGTVHNLDTPDKLQARLNIDGEAPNISFVNAFLPTSLQQSIRIPKGITLKGNVLTNGNFYKTNLKMAQGGGNIALQGEIQLQKMQYKAVLRTYRFPLQNFVRQQGLKPITAHINLQGRGTNVFSNATQITATGKIDAWKFQQYNLSGVNLRVNMARGVAKAQIQSHNDLLNGAINLDALVNPKRLQATFSCDIASVDLHKMGLTQNSLTLALCTHLDVNSDLKENHRLQGRISDITLRRDKQVYRPEDLTTDILSTPDTTHAIVNCGDFALNMDAQGGYEKLVKHGKKIAIELQKQIKEKYIDEASLRKQLPLARIYLHTGKENFFMRVLRYYGVALKQAHIDMQASPLTGLNGKMQVDSCVVDSILLDTIRFNVTSREGKMHYTAQVRNNKKNPQYVFDARLEGMLHSREASMKARIYDANQQLGVALGVQGMMVDDGIRLSIMDDHPILGYKSFAVNDSNYVFLASNRHVSANLQLRAEDETGIQVYTNDANTEVLQDITFSLNKFDLERLLSVIPYTPNVTGIMNGDFHVVQTTEDLSVSSAVNISKMTYEQYDMGNISSEFVYMPKNDGGHYIDGILMQNERQVASLSGMYHNEGGGRIDADLKLEEMPLELVNGFIPDRMIRFKGLADGTLSVKGSLSKPNVNGEVFLDSSYVASDIYGVDLRFDNDPVTIHNSRLLFENFQLYSHNDSPLVVAGMFDFSDLDHLMLDVRMRTNNFLLIDAKENYRSEAFGKAYINFLGMMKGELDNLQMQGKLDVLGATDMTYMLRDSPLTTDNQLEELVKFTDFSEKKEIDIERPQLRGFDMDMTININENAHILCGLNADKSNYVDLIGGGSLRMRYTVSDNLKLYGRYTLNNGEMKYSLPVIPLKTFTIKDGSYIQFTGDPMNPRLNITATETTKATVANGGQDGRIVEFECGVVVSKTLNNMGLEFIIDAPSDNAMSGQLNTMDKESRGKLAVTMLTTGMYLADGNTAGFSMNSALSAFLQTQINNIAGKALKTLDIEMGLENVTDAAGNMHTDYSFKFAKRFWNNKLRIIVGGKLSSDNSATPQNNTFFNNVSFEYRLNEGSTKYLQLYYNRDSYDWLEGNVGKYGFGFIWRRKLATFRDIFKWKDDKEVIPIPANDSVKKEKEETRP